MRLTFFLVPALVAVVSPAAGLADPTAGQGQSAEDVICKKELITGTLALYVKTCHTRAEWDRMARDVHDTPDERGL